MNRTELEWRLAYRTLRPALRECRGLLLTAIALGLAARWMFLPLPFLLRYALRRESADIADLGFVVGGVELRWPELALAGLLLLAGLRLGLEWTQRIAAEKAAQSAIAWLRRKMMDHLLRLKLSYFDRRAAGRVILRFVGDANAIRSFLAVTLVNLCADVPTVLVILALLVLINWKVALLACAAIPVVLLIFRRLNPELRTRTRRARSRQSRLCSHLTHRLEVIETVKASAAERQEGRAAADLIEAVGEAHVSRARIVGALAGITAAFFTAAFGLVIWLGGRLSTSGLMTVPDLLAFLLLLTFLQAPLRRCAGANAASQRAHVALARIHAFLRREKEPGYRRRKRRFRVRGERLELDDVAFRYRNNVPWVFDGLSFAIDGPGLVTLEGPTGIGKSTVMALILRLRQPRRGRILVDGVSLPRVNVKAVRRQIGWLPQEVKLLEGTVADNVRYGRTGLSDDEVCQLLARVMPGADADVPGLSPDTRVIGSGRNLSPLQRVRVGLARALASDARILLLDDPTAHMNPADEEALRRLIEELRGDRLIVVATSRRWILEQADQRIDLARIITALRDSHVENSAERTALPAS